MTSQHENNGQATRISFASFPDEQNCGLIVERARLPMVIWEDVLVLVRSQQGLTLMERFVMECLMTLGKCQAGELYDIASIPPELSNWMLGSLTQKGLARQDSNWFSPNKDACSRALAQKCVQVEQEERRAFIWFPETNELVVIRDAGNLLRRLRRLNAAATFPMPREWENGNRGEIIRDAMKQGRLYGDDAGTISNVKDDTPLDDSCPAYQCRAFIPRVGADAWQLVISGVRKRKRTSESDKHNGETNNYERNEQRLPVPLLPELVRTWHHRFALAVESIKNELRREFTITDVRFNEGEVTAILGRDAAMALSGQRLLVRRMGLEVCIDNEIDYAILIQLRPDSADQVAKHVFALDDAIQKILAAKSIAHAAESVCEQCAVLLSDLIDRLWQLRLFGPVYAIREAKDFGPWS